MDFFLRNSLADEGRLIRNLDMIMAACFNSAERTRADWLRLLEKADKRFYLHRITRPEGSTMSIIEVRWKSA